MLMSRNRTLWLFGLVVGALGPAGCVTGDSDNAAFLGSWHLAYVGGGAVTCEDAGTRDVILEGKNRRTGLGFRDVFQCDAGSGLSQALASGPYDLKLSLIGPGDRPISAITGVSDLFRRGTVALDQVEFRVQTFRVYWSLVRANMAVTCEQVGATTVRLRTRLGNEPKDVDYDFPCADRSAITTAVPTGPYTLQVMLLGPAQQVLSGTTAMAYPVDNTRAGDLPPITFEVK